MKKKFLAITVALVFIFSTFAFAYEENIKPLETGFTNILFSNGYYGFCLDRYLHGTDKDGDVLFTERPTYYAKSNADDSDISQKLKIMFTQCFEMFFISDGNGGYVLDKDKADSHISLAVYHFTGEQSYIWSDNKTYVNTALNYTGPDIPDEGYQKTLENGDVVTFYFMVLEPNDPGTQTFFAYKIVVGEEVTSETTTETTTESTTVETTTETTTESTTAETTTETTTESTTVETTTETTTEDDGGSGGEDITGSGQRPNLDETTTEEDNGGSGGEDITGSGGKPTPEESTTAQGESGNGGADDESTTLNGAQSSDPVKNPNTDRASYTRLLTILLIASGFGIVLFSNRKKLSYN